MTRLLCLFLLCLPSLVYAQGGPIQRGQACGGNLIGTYPDCSVNPGLPENSVQARDATGGLTGSQKWTIDPATGNLVGLCNPTTENCYSRFPLESVLPSTPNTAGECEAGPYNTGTETQWCWACFGDVRRCVAGTPTGGDITNGLLAHWEFNETSGTVVADATGNGNTGTLLGAVPSSRDGQMLPCNGTDNVVRIDNSSNPGHPLDLTSGPMTFHARFRFKANAEGAVIAKRNDAASQYNPLVADNGGRIGFRSTATEFGRADITPMVAETVYDFSVVVDTAGNPELYLNCAQQLWDDVEGTRPFSFPHATVNVSLCARFSTGDTPTFLLQSDIYEARIYNRRLSKEDLDLLCALPLQ